MELIVFAPGYRTQELSGVFADTTVHRQPAPAVRLLLANSRPELPAGTTAGLVASRTRPQGYRSPGGRIVSGGSAYGSAVDRFLGRIDQRLSADEAGEYLLETRGGGILNLQLEFRRRVERRLRTWSVNVQPAILDTMALPTGHVIVLTPEPESLQDALDEIGK